MSIRTRDLGELAAFVVLDDMDLTIAAALDGVGVAYPVEQYGRQQ
ncbi:hypothetical protein [Paracoccus amoyensis]|nr:hypothetical protein [Paracoccus amoyensis]